MYVLLRQPIFDINREVSFYEVFLQESSLGKHPPDMDPLKATSITIDIITELTPSKVGNGKKVFVNVPAIFLEASMFELLPPEFVGIELVENKSITNQLLEAINILVDAGYDLCVDDFGYENINYLPLVNKCTYVKINWLQRPKELYELKAVIDSLKEMNKKVIVKNIETEEDFNQASLLGFDYFQGFYLAKPQPVRDPKTLNLLRTTIIQLYEAIKKEDIKRITEIIERDVGATFKLLKFVNSVYFSRIRKISSVEEAVSYLGLNNIANFVLSVAISEMFASEEEQYLWEKSLNRALLAEYLADIYIPHLKQKAYIVGLFSLIGEIMNSRPEDIARELKLDPEIIEAYETRKNDLGFILSIIELLEDRKEKDIVNKVAKILKTTPEKIEEAISKAREEAENLSSLIK